MSVFFVSRDKILDKLDAGNLPRNGPTEMYAGYGRGYRCAACDRTITPYDVEQKWTSAAASPAACISPARIYGKSSANDARPKNANGCADE